MKDELNNYKINNPDGTSSENLDVRKQRFDNDNPRQVKEDSLSGQSEVFSPTETFDDTIGASSAEKAEDSVNMELSEATSAMASASASVGGSLGALAGIVAASIATVIIVVAVFVSTLSINLSLVMADMHSLVFEVEMRGAQEKDFEDPIHAILTGPEETYREQQIYPDSLYVTFDDLEPNQEYLVVIKNSSKEFVKKSFFTARSSVVNGQISSHFLDSMVFVSVNDVSLSAGEYYTLIAKDAKGNVLFSKDDTKSSAEYRFSVLSKENIYLSLIINGKARSVSTLEVSNEPEPEGTTEYDFDNPLWTWNEELVSVTFADKNGGASLVLTAVVASEVIAYASCETAGSEKYIATVQYDGKEYSDEKTVILDALGHDTVHHDAQAATCTEVGWNAYDTCSRCDYTTYREIAALGHVYGEWIERVNATSTTEANGVMPHYECTVCHRCFDEEDNEIFDLNYRLTYADPTWAWTYDGAGVPIKATATFIEEHGDETVVLEATDDHLLDRLVSTADCESPGYYYRTAYVMLHDGYYDNSNNPDYWSENYVREPALGHDYGNAISGVPATCEEDGMKEYYKCSRCQELFVYEQGEYVKVEEEDLVISAFGHDYGDPIPQVDADCEHTGLEEHYECSRCGNTFVYEGGQYTEASESDLTIPVLGELILLDPTAINPVMTVGQGFVGKSVIFMTADKSATVLFGAQNNTSKDVNQYSVLTILYVNSAPSIVLTYTDGGNTYYLNTTELGGIVEYNLAEREGSYDQILFKSTNENRVFVRKDYVEYYFVYDVASESIVLTSDVSEVSEDKFVYMYVLPTHTYGELIPSTATCENGGTAAHYVCSVCHKVFDENKVETTLQALAVPSIGHTYGEWIPENEGGNGLMAHYECSVCHKLFDENHAEKTAEELAIGDGTGLYVSRITTDMLPGTDKPTADLFDGFVAVSWDEIKDWTSQKSGTFYVIYAFDAGGFYYCTFENGVVTNESAESTYNPEATNENVRYFIDTYGFAFYYTLG